MITICLSRPTRLLIAALFFLHPFAIAAQPPAAHNPLAGCTSIADSVWNKLKPAQRMQRLLDIDPSGLDNHCLALLCARLGEYKEREQPREPFLAVHAQVQMQRAFPLELLGLLSTPDPQKGFTDENWESVLALWEQHNGTIERVINTLIEKGQQRQADSILSAFDTRQSLTKALLYPWAEIAHVLEKSDRCATLLCRAAQASLPRGVLISQSYCTRFLADNEQPYQEQLLSRFSDCLLGLSDTVSLREWVWRTASRFSLYELQLQTLAALSTASNPAAEQLLTTAHAHFGAHRYELASRAAQLALDIGHLPPELSMLATSLLFSSALQRGKADSALLYLKKILPGATAIPPEAVGLLQQAGLFDRADSLMQHVGSPLSRDTLALRRWILTGNADEGWKAFQSLSQRSHWRSQAPARTIWKARLALASGLWNELKSTLDSSQVPAQHLFAHQLLTLSVRYERLKNDPLALRTWSRIERLLLAARLDSAALAISTTALEPLPFQILSLEVLPRLLATENSAMAATLLDGLDLATAPPSLLYYSASTMLGQGDAVRARQLLEGILINHPRDIYSSRARVLLRSIGS